MFFRFTDFTNERARLKRTSSIQVVVASSIRDASKFPLFPASILFSKFDHKAKTWVVNKHVPRRVTSNPKINYIVGIVGLFSRQTRRSAHSLLSLSRSTSRLRFTAAPPNRFTLRIDMLTFTQIFIQFPLHGQRRRYDTTLDNDRLPVHSHLTSFYSGPHSDAFVKVKVCQQKGCLQPTKISQKRIRFVPEIGVD